MPTSRTLSGGGGKFGNNITKSSKSIRSDIFNQKSSLAENFNQTNGNTGIASALYANGIYDRLRMGLFDKFTRIPALDPYNAVLGTKEYIFITKPDLCLLSGTSLNPAIGYNVFLSEATKNYLPVMRQLQSSSQPYSTPFMTILSNSLTSSMDLSSISADSVETSSNIMGTKISYRGSSYKSDDDHDFSLEFEDNKYLDIYMLFKIYDEYERLKWNGSIDLSSQEHWLNYITNRVLHDQMSIYKFIVDATGTRIIYWARITGCYPISVPRDNFSDAPKDGLKYTIQWKGNFIRDMDPIILEHFNFLVFNNRNSLYNKKDLPLYDSTNSHFEGHWASTPYIKRVTNANNGYHRSFNSDYNTTRTEYHLMWKE